MSERIHPCWLNPRCSRALGTLLRQTPPSNGPRLARDQGEWARRPVSRPAPPRSPKQVFPPTSPGVPGRAARLVRAQIWHWRHRAYREILRWLWRREFGWEPKGSDPLPM